MRPDVALAIIQALKRKLYNSLKGDTPGAAYDRKRY